MLQRSSHTPESPRAGAGSDGARASSGTDKDAKGVSIFKQQAFWMGCWYVCSGGTLFLNKIILTELHGDIQVLAGLQMTTTAFLGALKVYGPRLLGGASVADSKYSNPEDEAIAYATFKRNMLLVALMRATTVILGLVSLSYVAASFTETIKASAPFFTVIFAKWILHEQTSTQVNLALVPVMAGLVLCSATELSFNMIGFLAAVCNNCVDCVQNVFSKKLLTTGGLTPVQLQFYTSAAAACLQLPLMLYMGLGHKMLYGSVTNGKPEDPALVSYRWKLLLIDAVLYHLQSVTAYFTMSLLSPVSQSVANTVKRSLLIMLSIMYFGNAITMLNVMGMLTVIAGVFVYNHARINYPTGKIRRTREEEKSEEREKLLSDKAEKV